MRLDGPLPLSRFLVRARNFMPRYLLSSSQRNHLPGAIIILLLSQKLSFRVSFPFYTTCSFNLILTPYKIMWNKNMSEFVLKCYFNWSFLIESYKLCTRLILNQYFLSI